MRLSDVVSHADLASWPSIALALFLAAFVLIVIRTCIAGGRVGAQHAALPLDDGDAVRTEENNS